MKSRPLTTTLAILLTIVLAAPSAFLMAPQNVYAQWTTFEVNPALVATTPVIAAKTTFSAIKDTLNLISTYTNTAANVAMQINAYVLQPLAFVMSGNLLKLITASVLDFVIGKTNGTGAPQFVQDLNGNLQRVGDIQANAFFVQFGRNSNSPFASSIVSSLRTNYLWNTSSAGFFAANRNTMAMYSLNPNAFLNGNWSQGGVGAWFALTTQTQNNPYTFYQASQSQLASVVSSAQAARKAVLDWGQVFLSWCGANDASAPANEEEFPVAGGVSSGDSCYDKDGNLGTIKTPGSTIKATLDKVLGGTQDKLVQMGSVAKEINGILGQVGSILGNVGSVARTVMFESDILGGSNSGGLFGVGQTSATNPTSRLLQYQSPGYLGVTQSTVLQNAATIHAISSDTSGRLDQYESSWNTIRSAANSASTTVASLASFCIAEQSVAPTILNNEFGQSVDSFISASNAQATEARSAIVTKIAPVISQADAAAAVIIAARAVVQRMRSNENSTAQGAGEAYLADLQTLQSMPPSHSDISNRSEEAQPFSAAIAIPAGSLNVSGGTIIDRMNLISTNAVALKASVCTPIHVDPSTNGPSGGDQGGD